MPADRVPRPGDVWEFHRHTSERQRERSRLRIDAVGDDAVAATRLRNGDPVGLELAAFLAGYSFVSAAGEVVAS